MKKKILWMFRNDYGCNEAHYSFSNREPQFNKLCHNEWRPIGQCSMACSGYWEQRAPPLMHVEPGNAKKFEVIEDLVAETVTYRLVEEIVK